MCYAIEYRVVACTEVPPIAFVYKQHWVRNETHPRGDRAESAGLSLARALRQHGLMVELDSSGSAFGKQFKRADRSGARWALVLGDEEVERGEVRLKPLSQQSEESTVALSGIAAMVKLLRSR